MDIPVNGEDRAGVSPARSGPQENLGGRVRGAWARFRRWRRSRPFWGGLLLLLAGLELIGIPLLSVLAHGSVKVVIYIGIGGVFGELIGGLLVACGLLVWFHPVQRVFYAVAGVLLAVASFVATNLGGFFLGMLLGVTGASLSFGWAPGPGQQAGQYQPRRARTRAPSGGLGLLFGDRRSAGAASPGECPAPGETAAERPDRVLQHDTDGTGIDGTGNAGTGTDMRPGAADGEAGRVL